MEKVCKSCGTLLPVSNGGRPANYCSTACRRTAEFAIQRVAKRLEGLEARLSEARLGAYGNYWFLAVEGEKKEAAIAALEAEITLQNTRMRELLAD